MVKITYGRLEGVLGSVPKGFYRSGHIAVGNSWEGSSCVVSPVLLNAQEDPPAITIREGRKTLGEHTRCGNLGLVLDVPALSDVL